MKRIFGLKFVGDMSYFIFDSFDGLVKTLDETIKKNDSLDLEFTLKVLYLTDEDYKKLVG